jgi:hypothetical protein
MEILPMSRDFGFSPDGATIAYMADQDVDGLRELDAVAVKRVPCMSAIDLTL